MKRIKLLMYTTIFCGGGAERTILDIINNINLKKFEIILVVGRKNGIGYLKFLKRDKFIKYINLNSGDDEDYKIPDLLAKIITEEKPDICFAPGIFTNFILMDAIEKISYSGKIVIRESNYVSLRNLPKEAKDKITNQYNKCDKIISITKGIEKDLIKNYKISKDKFILINNPVEKELIRTNSLKKEKNAEFDKIKNKKIITVGRLEPQKNQIMLLKSFKKIKEKYHDVDLIILGQGSLLEELQGQAKDLKIDEAVHFLGFVDNPYYYLKNSDVFVLTSKYEGFPHVLLEAMTLEIPIISTNCLTGPKDILKKGKLGYLVKVDDTEKMSKKIMTLLKNNRKSSKKVKKAYKETEKYLPAVITQKYEKLFESVIDKG